MLLRINDPAVLLAEPLITTVACCRICKLCQVEYADVEAGSAVAALPGMAGGASFRRRHSNAPDRPRVARYLVQPAATRSRQLGVPRGLIGVVRCA